MSTATVVEYAPLVDLIVTEIHSGTEAHITRAIAFDFEGMTLRRSPARTRVGRYLWLEFGVAGRSMRVLARVVGRSAETTRVEFKHIWPDDRERYAEFLSVAQAAA